MINSCLSTQIADLTPVLILNTTAGQILTNQPAAAETLFQLGFMTSAKGVIPAINDVFTPQGFTTNTASFAEQLIVISIAVWLSIVLQKSTVCKGLAANCTGEVVFMPLMIKCLNVLAFDWLSTAKTALAKFFIIVMLTVRFTIALHELLTGKLLMTNRANKMLLVPLMPERFNVLSNYFFIASVTDKHWYSVFLPDMRDMYSRLYSLYPTRG